MEPKVTQIIVGILKTLLIGNCINPTIIKIIPISAKKIKQYAEIKKAFFVFAIDLI